MLLKGARVDGVGTVGGCIHVVGDMHDMYGFDVVPAFGPFPKKFSGGVEYDSCLICVFAFGFGPLAGGYCHRGFFRVVFLAGVGMNPTP